MQDSINKSIYEVAEIVGCSAPYVSRVLSGQRSDTSRLAKKIKYTAKLLRENQEAEKLRIDAIRDKVANNTDLTI
jgi:predicted transcriptional regulator